MSRELEPHDTIPAPSGPVLVCIVDGFGENQYKDKYNAVFTAKTPAVDALRAASGRWRTVRAHGTAVGLPSDTDMGNSEVGHNALGAGQVIEQGARLVDSAIASGRVFELDGWKYISPALSGHTLHIIFLLSDGGVHSRYDQIYGIAKGAAERGAGRIRFHILLDGRDVPDGSSIAFAEQLEKDCEDLTQSGCDARVASGGGRMYVTMDRYEADWNIVKRGWDAHVLGKAPHKFTNALDGLKSLKGNGDDSVSDQWIPPFVITDASGLPVGTIEDEDAVILGNFRADRMVEISKAFEYADFDSFDRERFPKDLKFVGMMQYDGDLKLPSHFLVPPPKIHDVSGQYLCANGIKTFACSETQKFGHVTFFWNGNRSGYIDRKVETYLEIPSDKVPFNQLPRMKAPEICEAGKEALRSGKYKMVRLNFANPDMVGHTGDLAATVQAVECVDQCVKELLETCDEVGGRWLISADHGNADDMVQRTKKGEPIMDADGKPLPLTSHTLSPVGVSIGGGHLPPDLKFRDDLPKAGLANITATFINLLGLKAPDFYEESLI